MLNILGCFGCYVRLVFYHLMVKKVLFFRAADIEIVYMLIM